MKFDKVIYGLIIFLICLVIFCFYTIDSYRKIVEEKTTKITKLEKELKTKIVVSDNSVKIVYRDKEIAVEKKIYVPVSDGGNISILEYLANNPSKRSFWESLTTKWFAVPNSTGTVVVAKIAGFTFRPLISAEMDETLSLSWNLDFRFFYYERYGLSIGAYPKLFISVDRHIDDIIPFFKNSVFGVYYSFVPKQYGIRIATYF